MLFKIFGALDILAGVSYLLYHYDIIKNWMIPLYFGIYLILKVAFMGFEIEFANVGDLISGIIILIGAFWTNQTLGIIVCIWLGQKGFISFL